MALQNPLENFNRHNPYVMQAKYQYQNLMDECEALSKDFVMMSIATLIGIIICAIVGIIGCLTAGAPALIPFICIFLFTGVIEWGSYKILKERVQDAENEKMDKMASLEMNEVQEINQEFVYNLINLIYSLQGKANQARKSLRTIGTILVVGLIGYIVCIFTLIACV
ncbi:MAG: hypothetical protein NC548_06345 [Lachnospiraceae bacterium]|nr:hypothetical protein [Lachnospiraceae bacterium]